MRHPLLAVGALGAVVLAWWPDPRATGPAALGSARGQDPEPASRPQSRASQDPPFVTKALAWLARAQQKDGGFGAGSHARQDVRDAQGVPTDPATTAVAASALLRAQRGIEGCFRDPILRATEYLLHTIELAKAEGPKITELVGTQPQAKMGENVDTALAAQFLARLLEELPKTATLRPRVVAALDKCLDKIEKSQGKDGSWASSGWAPVLQSAQMSTALELGGLAGRAVDQGKLASAREYQKRQVDAQGAVRADAAAGVKLYASAANQRGVAAEARAAREMVEAASRASRSQSQPQAAVTADALIKLGVAEVVASKMEESFALNEAGKKRMFDGALLDGFGNNGGEEFLSYQMTAESLAIDGGPEQAKWSKMIHERLARVQSQDGSWTGQHCITSPVFCTAAALSCLTADRDVEWLRKSGKTAKR